MSGRWGAALVRLGFVVLGMVVLAAAAAAAFAGAGRPTDQAIAAGCGSVGVVGVLLGAVLLGLARRGSGQITQATGLGALALSLPFLALALVL